ncbi:MAG: histidine kinase [Salinivirgaceae bacterium]|jgi:two-component system LytT family sensor kinase|nr:histidine kinase [Salinivirgaceae bacterium]
MNKISSNKLFWILQIIGWLSYYLIYTAISTWYKSFSSEDLMLYSLTYVLGFIITVGLRYPYRYVYSKIERLYWLPITIVVGSVITTLLWTYIDMYVSHFFWDNGDTVLRQRLQLPMLIKYSFIFIILMTSWSSLYFGIKYAIDWQNEKKHSEQAEMMAQKAQMEMLRYQLNPHFLFNSLNSIRALVDENQKHAKEMITELSEFLRYSLQHKDATFVTLINELEAVKHYFSIEKKRFEEKLEIEYKIADEVRNYQVLTFLLHPLIENAVKYGMQTSQMPLKIGLSAQKTGAGLMLEICNSGIWIDRKGDGNHIGGTGTGLANVEKRLKNAYGDGYRLEILKGEKNICIRIEIKEQYLYG